MGSGILFFVIPLAAAAEWFWVKQDAIPAQVIAGRRVELLRMTARTWFDTVIWRRLGSGAIPTNLTAAQVMEEFVKSALDDMNRLSDTMARAAEISVAMSALPGQFRRILDRKLAAPQNATPTGQSGPVVTPLPRTSVTRPVPKK